MANAVVMVGAITEFHDFAYAGSSLFDIRAFQTKLKRIFHAVHPGFGQHMPV